MDEPPIGTIIYGEKDYRSFSLILLLELKFQSAVSPFSHFSIANALNTNYSNNTHFGRKTY